MYENINFGKVGKISDSKILLNFVKEFFATQKL